LDEKPFGENVKGISAYRAKIYFIKAKGQTEDFEDSALCGIICRTPLVHKALRKCKCLHGNVGVFVMASRGVRAAGIHKKMFSQVNLLAGTGESPVS
jgi:hypothetical protein